MNGRRWATRVVLCRCSTLFSPSGVIRRSGSQYHGSHGEIQVSQLRNDHPHCAAWLRAAGQLGLAQNDDFNGTTTLGVGAYHLSIGRRWRSSAARAFLKPAMKRPNLTVLTKVLVEKIIIRNRRAEGVRVRVEGETTDIMASREVILSAGAIQSPQLLQLSGIGPGKLLKSFGDSCHCRQAWCWRQSAGPLSDAHDRQDEGQGVTQQSGSRSFLSG